jgi:hypothetical protein
MLSFARLSILLVSIVLCVIITRFFMELFDEDMDDTNVCQSDAADMSALMPQRVITPDGHERYLEYNIIIDTDKNCVQYRLLVSPAFIGAKYYVHRLQSGVISTINFHKVEEDPSTGKGYVLVNEQSEPGENLYKIAVVTNYRHWTPHAMFDSGILEVTLQEPFTPTKVVFFNILDEPIIENVEIVETDLQKGTVTVNLKLPERTMGYLGLT